MRGWKDKNIIEGGLMMCRFILTLSMLVCVAGVVVADTSTLDETKTRVALPLPEPPTIDGVLDLEGEESWVWATGVRYNSTESNWRIAYDEDQEDWVRGGFVSSGDGPIFPEDIDAQIYVGYDEDNLYVGVRVMDDVIFTDSAEANSQNQQTWHDDSVEVFVDGDNSNFDSRDTTGENPEVVDTGGQFVITANNAYREAEAGNPGYGEDAAWYALTSETDQGYDAEFRISMDAIGNPEPGELIGFTVAVNDDDTGEDLNYQLIWVGETHVESTYGNLIIGKRTYTAPKTDPPVVDGVINADEYAEAEEIVVNPHTGVYDAYSRDDSWEIGDHGFSAWLVHDNEAIYVAVDVTDDNVITDTAAAGSEDENTWQDDSVEVFIDADNSNSRGRDPDETPGDGQYVMTANGAHRDAEAFNPTFGSDWNAEVSETDEGFQVEFQIMKSVLGEPEDGSTVGLNLNINDDDGEDGKAQLNWAGNAHVEHSWGILTLGGGTRVEEWSLY